MKQPLPSGARPSGNREYVVSESFHQSFDRDKFSGRARLFPLPNLVLFPHVLQPLHVFEPRYREMVEDALADDRLIAMSLLAPGWERDYEGRPPVHPVCCLGRIATWHRLDNGRYNLLLQGLCRTRLVRELPPVRSFREAEVVIQRDLYPAASATARPALQRRLLECFAAALRSLPSAQEQLDQLREAELSLGMLTDVVAYTLDFELPFKQRLLDELDVDTRARQLIDRIATGTSPATQPNEMKFPPDFSVN